MPTPLIPPGSTTFDRGVLAYRAKDHPQAIALFTRALEMAPRGNKLLMTLDSRAAAYEAMDEIKDALKDARECIEIAPMAVQGYLRSAKLFQRIDQLPRAREVLLLGLSRIPGTSSTTTTTSSSSTADSIATVPTSSRSKHDRIKALLIAIDGAIRSSARLDPVRHLPPEVWSLILTFGVQMGGDEYALVPAAVSRSWREATLGCTQAWRRLRLTEKTKRSRCKAEEWVRRSGGRLETLKLEAKGHARRSFRTSSGSSIDPEKGFDQVLEPTLSSLTRLEIIGHRSDFRDVYRLIRWPGNLLTRGGIFERETRASTCSHLRYLYIHAVATVEDRHRAAQSQSGPVNRHVWQGGIFDLALLAVEAPNLETLKLQGISVAPVDSTSVEEDGSEQGSPSVAANIQHRGRSKISELASHAQLTRLRVLDLSDCEAQVRFEPINSKTRYISVLDTVFAHSHNLKSVRLRNVHLTYLRNDLDGDASLPEPCASHKMVSVEEYVEIGSTFHHWSRALMHRLEMPNLRTLRLSTGGYLGAADWQFSFLLTKTLTSLHRLRSLYWSSLEANEEELAATLPDLSDLRHLELGSLRMDVLLHLLPILPRLCPRLESLVLRNMIGSASPLLKLVKSRLAGLASQGEMDARLTGSQEVLDADGRDPASGIDGGEDPKNATKRKADGRVVDEELDVEVRASKRGKKVTDHIGGAFFNKSAPEAEVCIATDHQRVTRRHGQRANEESGRQANPGGCKVMLASEVPVECMAPASMYMRINSISVHHCDEFEKEAEEWLRQKVADFSIVWPPREKKDKFRS